MAGRGGMNSRDVRNRSPVGPCCDEVKRNRYLLRCRLNVFFCYAKPKFRTNGPIFTNLAAGGAHGDDTVTAGTVLDDMHTRQPFAFEQRGRDRPLSITNFEKRAAVGG